jgi:hypothetical protein
MAAKAVLKAEELMAAVFLSAIQFHVSGKHDAE